MSSLEPVLADGLEQLGVPLSSSVQAKLLDYVRLLTKWNRVYNLTRVRGASAMVQRHLLDSLAVAPYLEGMRIIDVGSGAGVPGIPLALARPRFAFTLLDANAKRTRFMIQAVGELGLTNVEVVRSRVEDYTPLEPFDTVVARAFAPLPELLRLIRHVSRSNGVVLAMKGVLTSSEYTDLPAGFELQDVVVLQVPGVDAKRHLLRLRSKQ